MKNGELVRKKLRIVIDTSVLISALHFGGKPEEVLFAANAGFIQLYLSPFILTETRNVLTRKLHWPSDEIIEAENVLKEIATIIVPKEELSVIKNSDADNAILACAIAVKAHFLVTGDKKHLLSLKKFQNIEIVSPEVFLKRIS